MACDLVHAAAQFAFAAFLTSQLTAHTPTTTMNHDMDTRPIGTATAMTDVDDAGAGASRRRPSPTPGWLVWFTDVPSRVAVTIYLVLRASY